MTATRSPYAAFVAGKRLVDAPSGIDCASEDLDPRLFPFQREITAWALRRGRAAILAATGLGKTAMQLAWADQVAREREAPVLIFAPLAVSAQTVQEGVKFGVQVTSCRHIGQMRDGVNVTNYERLDRFDPEDLAGVVLDESSILKAFDGSLRKGLTDFAQTIPHRLCCSATPAPNEFIELGSQAEFLGVMTQQEMLALYFTQDGNTTQKFRLKGHAREPFWDWVASWAVACRRPSDLGYENDGYDLPPLTMIPAVVEVDPVSAGMSLFPVEATTLDERRKARQATIKERCALLAERVAAEPDEPWVIWCGLNAESDTLRRMIPGAVEVTGSQTAEYKEAALLWFAGSECLCSNPLFGSKLSEWRSLNDPIRNTCGPITAPISTDGRNAPLSSGPPITPTDALDMQPIQSGGVEPLRKRESGGSQIPKPTSRAVSESTASRQRNTEPSSISKVGVARSVNANSASMSIPEVESGDDSTLITATTRDGCEESSAHPATLASASSTMTRSDSRTPPCICGHASGRRILVSKASIAGFGMNFQHCARVGFCGISDSFEQLFQAVRRCWRFGQTREVVCHVVTASTEGAVVRNIERKEKQWEAMMDETVRRVAPHALGRQARETQTYEEEEREGDGWRLLLGDCVERIATDVEDESVGLTIFSPPFPGMYVYTNSPHDMGNVRSTSEMIDQFRFLIPELLRVTIPGRSCCVHLTQGTAQKVRDGYIGIRDFRGKIIEAMENEGWIYYGEVTIDKDPQVKAIRTKDRGLLFKSLANDAANMHMALADYLLQFRKRGENPQPIRAGTSEKYGNQNGWITPEEWIEWAAPVWYRASQEYPGGIRETDVLNVRAARDERDERHLAPLQLGVIERAVKLWSAPGDLVLSPFAGIGSEGYVALQHGRRFVGVELKRSYFEQASRNLAVAKPQISLLD